MRWQQGTLYSNSNGYVVVTNGVYSRSTFALSEAVLAQVSDKMVMQLSLWLGLESIPRYSLKNSVARSRLTRSIKLITSLLT